MKKRKWLAKKLITKALRGCSHNQTQAADQLGIHKANQEETEEAAYQEEFTGWDQTLADGLSTLFESAGTLRGNISGR